MKARGVSQGVQYFYPQRKQGSFDVVPELQNAKFKLQIEIQNAKHGVTEEIQSGTEKTKSFEQENAEGAEESGITFSAL